MAEQREPGAAGTTIGQIIGGYRIVSRIGAGGMGEVYLAEHLRIERRVAIKVLLPEMSSRTDTVARFFAEARATSSIRHPGIVEVIDCDVQAGGRAYIVMELLEGQSLLARMAGAPSFGQDERTALGVTGEIAGALAAAHRKNIVHRDLKPDNIFLANDPREPGGFVVKILDFGIAKLLSNDSGDSGPAGMARTRTGALLGTPTYMSPEQCRGAAAVDWRADIYAMGCILFEMLAGRPPFVYDGFGELIAAHIGEAPPALRALRPQVSAPVAAFVARLLEKDPARRPQTMEAAGQEIAVLLGQVLARESATDAAAGAGGVGVRTSRAGSREVPVSSRGARVMVAASGTGPGGTLLAEPPNPMGKSQTTLSEMAAEGTPGRRSKPGARARIWLPIVAIGLAGGAAGIVIYQHQAQNQAVSPTGGSAAREAIASPAAAAGAVNLQVGDPAAAPTATAGVDAAAAAAAEPMKPPEAPAVTRPAHPVAPAVTPASRHRRHTDPAPLDLNDEERKL